MAWSLGSGPLGPTVAADGDVVDSTPVSSTAARNTPASATPNPMRSLGFAHTTRTTLSATCFSSPGLHSAARADTQSRANANPEPVGATAS
jgi:hypothetical protein